MADFVTAMDQGTPSTRFMLFDHSGAEVARQAARGRKAGWRKAGWRKAVQRAPDWVDVSQEP